MKRAAKIVPSGFEVARHSTNPLQKSWFGPSGPLSSAGADKHWEERFTFPR